MSDIKWIKLTTNMFDDDKIKLIEAMPDADSILVIWIKLLIQAGKTNASGYIFLNENIPFSEDMLATLFNRPLNTIRFALETFQRFGMIEIDEQGIYINNWQKHQNVEGMERIREQNRQRVQRHRQKLKSKDNVTLHETLRNAPELEGELEGDPDKDTLEHFFEELWRQYPRKKGKGKISKTKKNELHKVGKEHMERAIARFKKDMEKEGRPIDKYMYGSTFFNSGYIDYLDGNYTEDAGGESKWQMA